mgnify:CR=1 FL=1
MPRQARIDAPGALHHIIARGIAKKPIFIDNYEKWVPNPIRIQDPPYFLFYAAPSGLMTMPRFCWNL